MSIQKVVFIVTRMFFITEYTTKIRCGLQGQNIVDIGRFHLVDIEEVFAVAREVSERRRAIDAGRWTFQLGFDGSLLETDEFRLAGDKVVSRCIVEGNQGFVDGDAVR